MCTFSSKDLIMEPYLRRALSSLLKSISSSKNSKYPPVLILPHSQN